MEASGIVALFAAMPTGWLQSEIRNNNKYARVNTNNNILLNLE